MIARPFFLLRTLVAVTAVFFTQASLLFSQIVSQRSPVDYSHTIMSRGVEIGLSNKGGGYISHLKPNNTIGNVIAQGFGRGGQVAVRDWLHSGRHNPTQAGVKDNFGRPVTLTTGNSTRGGSNNRIVIGNFSVPLYLNGIFDFTQYEDIVPDHGSFSDGGNTDTDGITEPGQTQTNEITSEFDMSGFMQDSSSLAPNTTSVAVFEWVLNLDFKRTAASLNQFGAAARNETGGGVLSERGRLTDVSPTALTGNQEADDDDYGAMIHATGVWLQYDKNFRWMYWIDESGVLRNQQISTTFEDGLSISGSDFSYGNLFPNGETDAKTLCNGNPGDWDGTTRSGLIMLGNSSNASSAVAVAMFFPKSATNNRPIYGLRTSDNSTAYREDRLIHELFGVSRAGSDDTKTMDCGPDGNVTINNDISLMTRRTYVTGMLNRNSNSNIYERYRNQCFILVGTPNAIKAAAAEIESRL